MRCTDSINRRPIAAVLASAVWLGAASLEAIAQTPPKLPRVGILYLSGSSSADMAHGFQKGMEELGYVDGRNVVYEWRDAEGRPERLAALAADLAKSNVDVIFTGGPGPLAAARNATGSVPIVTVGGSDPVGEGWARSLSRPGGNVTGLTVTYPELSSKRLELAKELLPAIVRVGVLLNPNEVPGKELIALLEGPARRLGVALQVLEFRDPADIEPVFRAAQRTGVQAILMMETPVVGANRRQLAEQAAQARLPLIGEFTAFGADGLTFAYGANINDLLRRAAAHVDRILKGSRPGDLPIERPTKFDLTVNLKTARTLGIPVPQAMLLQADKVIE
jgi:putative tryptophan/tyrosine transport system substrate-binding protein